MLDLVISILIFLDFIFQIFVKKLNYFDFHNDEEYTYFQLSRGAITKLIINIISSIPNYYIIQNIKDNFDDDENIHFLIHLLSFM